MLLSLQEEAEAEGASQPAMMDPIADLKLNQLDIVDAVRERQALLQVSLLSSDFAVLPFHKPTSNKAMAHECDIAWHARYNMHRH